MSKPKKLGHVVLRVRELEKSERFYREALGLDVTARIPGRMVFLSASGESSHDLGLMSIGADAPRPDPGRAGMYHCAWEMESFEALQQIYWHLRERDVQIAGIGDHGISLGVYFPDPDGNEIEVFYELPRSQWPQPPNEIFSGTFPRRLEEAPALA